MRYVPIKQLVEAAPMVTEALPVLTEAQTPVVEIRPVFFPRPKEIVYFDKQANGTLSVGESGIIFGRNISQLEDTDTHTFDHCPYSHRSAGN
jgi:hypothetical protein